jgi:hypothetical protein
MKIPEIRDNETFEHLVYDDAKAEKPSSNIRKATYRPHNKKLTVEFKNDSIYEYSEVPSEIIDEWENADSVGSFHYWRIRNAFPYQQVG